MKEKIQQLIKQKEQLLTEIKSFVQNKEIDLNERWDVFEFAGKQDLLPTKSWIERFEGELEEWLDEDILNGDIVNRYETFSASNCLDYAKDNDKSEEFINDLKEQWIEKFIWSFEFDW